MNKKQIYLNRQEVLEYFNPRTIKGKQGFVKVWGDDKGHCSDEHELVKFLVCKKLRFVYGFEFWTEAELVNNKGRVDILCIDKIGAGYIIEILSSETEERFLSKKDKYPLPIIKVKTKGFNVDKWDF